MNSQVHKVTSLGKRILCWKHPFLHQTFERKLVPDPICCRNFSLVSKSSFVHRNVVGQRFNTTANLKDMDKSLTDKAKEEKKMEKKKAPPKILTIDGANKIHVVTIEEAGKMAKKAGLHLIEVDPSTENMKTTKQVYKLVSSGQFYGEDIKPTEAKDQPKESGDTKVKQKEEKIVMMKSKTTEHDALTKAKSIRKFIEKGHPVKVFIGQVGDGSNPETVCKILEDNLKTLDCRIVQKVIKSSQIRFQVLPPKPMTVKEFIVEGKKKENKQKQLAEKLEKEKEREEDGDEEEDQEKGQERK